MRNVDIPIIAYASQSETASIHVCDEDFVVADKSCTIILHKEVHAYTGKIITVIANADCNVLNTEIGTMVLLPRYRLTVVAMVGQWCIIGFYRPVATSIGIEKKDDIPPPPPPPPPPPDDVPPPPPEPTTETIKIDVPIGASKTYNLKGLYTVQLWRDFGGDLKLWLNISNTNNKRESTMDGWSYSFDPFGTGYLFIENAKGLESVVYYVGKELNVAPEI